MGIRIAWGGIAAILLVGVLAGCASTTADRAGDSSEVERLRELLAERDRLIEELEERLDRLELLVAHAPERPRPRYVPAIDATVTAVQEGGDVVILSAGLEAGVRVGYEFTVFRGNEYVAMVVVDEVEKGRSRGHSKEELERCPIVVGDEAKTRF